MHPLWRMCSGVEDGMIPVPARTKVWLAAGVTDMRKEFERALDDRPERAGGGPVLRSTLCIPGPQGRPHQGHLVGRSGRVRVHEAAGEGSPLSILPFVSRTHAYRIRFHDKALAKDMTFTSYVSSPLASRPPVN